MLGAIIGDTVGSRFEWHNHRSKDFDFLTYKCEPTDDSIMTLSVIGSGSDKYGVRNTANQCKKYGRSNNYVATHDKTTEVCRHSRAER